MFRGGKDGVKMSEKMKELLFQLRRLLGELGTILNEIENSLIKEDLEKDKDH